MTGLSGIGEFLLDMYHFTGEAHYLHQAHTVASGVMLYAVPQEHGIAFPGEELIRLSADFATGAAGIGAFLHRLLNQARTPRLVYDCNSLHEPAAVEMAVMALPN
jgi:lantibiotic modifying enzyme